MKDEDPQIFQHFVHWLYYDKFPGESLDDDAGLVKQWQGQNIFDGRLSVNLMRLYVFGEKRIIPHLKEICMAGIFGYFTRSGIMISSPLVRFVFSNLPSTSPLLRFVIDHGYRRIIPERCETPEHWPVEYLHGIMCRHALISKEIRDGTRQSNYKLSLQDYQEPKTEQTKD